MLVAITAGLLQMAQQYKQLDLKFTVAGTTFFADPSVIADPAPPVSCTPRCGSMRRRSWPRSSRQNTAPTWNSSPGRYYNAAQIVLTTLDKVLADNKPVTGENMRDTLLRSASSRA